MLTAPFLGKKMIERLDKTWERGVNFNYRDLGPVSAGRKTRVFKVQYRIRGTALGTVRWFAQARQYVFFPDIEECVFLSGSEMQEMYEYLKLKTFEHKEKRSKT